jgi:MFS family permease
MVGALVLFAPITGYIAASYGRSFWRWYGLGVLLPFFSMFVAIFVAIRTQLAEEKATSNRRNPKP